MKGKSIGCSSDVHSALHGTLADCLSQRAISEAWFPANTVDKPFKNTSGVFDSHIVRCVQSPKGRTCRFR